MANPEHDPHNVHDREGLFRKLKELLKQVFSQKAREEARAKKKVKKKKEEGEKAQHEEARYETREKWEEEERKRAEREKDRPYHEAKSAEVERMKAEMARVKRAEEVKIKLENIVKNREPEPEGSLYLISVIRRDENLQQALGQLVESSSVSAEVVDSLLSKREVHGSARDLITKAQMLAYEAGKSREVNFAYLKPLFEAVSSRANDLLWEEMQLKKKAIQESGGKGEITYADLLARDTTNIIISDEERASLVEPVRDDEKINWKRTKEEWGRRIEEIITSKKETTPEEKTRAQAIQDTGIQPNQQTVKQLVTPIDTIWGEVELKAAKKQLTKDDLVTYSEQIWEEEAKILPKDVPPGSDDYNSLVKEIAKQVDNKIQVLTEMLRQRLKEETPSIKGGIKDVGIFLEEMAKNKGHLGVLLARNPEMNMLFFSVDPDGKGRKFRDRVFLTIHSAVLSDRRNSSNDNFGLYERADFTTFNDLIRLNLGKYKVRETRKPLGEVLADHYNNLSNTIKQCRDIDFWASQPAATVENWNKSLGMFQNEYVKTAFNIPAVCAAFRAYETTLRSIIASNDGYLPPALVDYDPTTSRSFWDDWSQAMLEQMIAMGSVPDMKRDPMSGLNIVDPDGRTVVMDLDNPLKNKDLSPEELKMYMTLAKGMGMATARYLEIIANTRVPGSNHPELGMDQFHSMPYEKIAQALNYFNVFIHKWKIGSYKYFYLLNQLIPKEKQLRVNRNDPGEAIRAYMAYQDGTFEAKYSKDAKRFIDMTNFSGISSAIGKTTRWRQYDTTVGWSDVEKQRLGGPTQLILCDRYAEEKVKDLLVVGKYKEEYRKEVIRRNREKGSKLPIAGAGFDKLWKEYGRGKYRDLIEKKWEELTGKDAVKGYRHTALQHQTKNLIETYEKAYKARVWVEMAMRNPLVVAHNLKVDLPYVGIEGTKKMSFHRMLIQDILGIPPEDTKYGEEWGRSAEWKTPTQRQLEYMTNVLTLEGDLAAVREFAVNKGRDLTEVDFREIIKDEGRRRHALKYWEKVRQVILGSTDFAEAKGLYEQFGLGVAENQMYYKWDEGKIHSIEDTLSDLVKKYGKNVTTIKSQEGKNIPVPFLLKEAIEMQPEWILGTDDMAFNKMDLLNLGSRQLIRRGGDIAAHQVGGDAAAKYLVDGLVPTPDKSELGKMLKELRNAYSGDMIEIGWSVAGNLAYMTDRIYSWDWSRLGSIAQTDIWGTRRGVAAWMANGRREFWDVLEHMDVLPPHGHYFDYSHIGDAPVKYDIHNLRKMCHADNADVWKEIIMLGLLLALALTIWRALTAPSEEEEGGGGRGGHH